MHMADALISPAVGGTLWTASAALVALCCRKIRTRFDSALVPLMGVMGAFIFAAQMINFTIPGTGSSGHLGGALLLAALLGPHAALLTIASVLVVQALFFADGGLLALGCNIFNLGFFPCFVAYLFIYKPLAGVHPSRARLTMVSVAAATAGLQMGAFAVVLETTASGISALPFGGFLLLMQPIHLVIGVVEGLATAAVIAFVQSTRPEIFVMPAASGPSWTMKKLVTTFTVLTVCLGSVLSWFSSTHPDGLEWSIAGVRGSAEFPVTNHPVHAALAKVQEKTALMPDYALPSHAQQNTAPKEDIWFTPDLGTSMAGIVGGALTLLLAGILGFILRRRDSPPYP